MNTEKIKERMKEKGLTQHSLAEKLGVSVGCINLLINGKRKGSIETLKRFCEELECEPEEIW